MVGVLCCGCSLDSCISAMWMLCFLTKCFNSWCLGLSPSMLSWRMLRLWCDVCVACCGAGICC